MNDMNITLATLHNYSAQEVFDYVCNHLLTQNEKSVDKKGLCKYRGINNTKCAAGCLISDEEYDRTIEGYSWHGVMGYHQMANKNEYLITKLQDIHDNESTRYWGIELQELAEKEGLKFNYPE